ncbi:MAG: ABC transporter substrate-binding protein [Deltaproteobacteria bacterium]|nr:ABC transporter substrate-binding protein [Deltaproteobacteria bacterium]
MRLPRLLLALLAATGCKGAAPRPTAAEVMIDDVGHTMRIPAKVERIVSLSPAATELLCAVGCCGKLVARDAWSDFPPEVRGLPQLPGFSPSPEALLLHKPDLVLLHFPPPNLQSVLDAAGIAWFGLAAADLKQVAQAHRVVGRLCGQPERGTQAALAFVDAVAAVRKQFPRPTRPPRVFYELDAGDGQRPFTVGRRAFGHALIEAAGAHNVFGERDEAWFAVGVEALLAADPDVVVLGDADVPVNPQSRQTLGERTGFAALRAVRAGCVATVPNTLVSRPGPRLVDGLRAMAAAVRACAGGPP